MTAALDSLDKRPCANNLLHFHFNFGTDVNKDFSFGKKIFQSVRHGIESYVPSLLYMKTRPVSSSGLF